MHLSYHQFLSLNRCLNIRTKGFDSGKTWMTITTALENIRKCEMEENLEENSELDLDCLKGYKEYLLDLNEQLK